MTVLTPTRIAIKEIVMATDYSPVSEAALPYAVGLARHFGAGLHVVHVLLPGEWEPTADDTSTAFEYQPVKEAERHMAAFLSTQSVREVRCDYLIRRGPSVWEEISKIVEDKSIDMIVLGTHGRGGIEKLLVGSVAEEIFRNAPCPVLTIGPRISGPAPAAFRKIAFATDLTKESLNHLPFVMGLAEEYQAKLVIIHVPAGYYVPSAEVIESARQRMRQLIPPQANLEYAVEFGDPAFAIRRTAEDCECDLIVLGAHVGVSTHLAGNTVHKILLEAHCPVLTVHWFPK